jgi:hypothetical protein
VEVGVLAAEPVPEAAQAAVGQGQVLLALPAYGNRCGVVEQEAVALVVVAAAVEEGREAAGVVSGTEAVLVSEALAVGVDLVAVE